MLYQKLYYFRNISHYNQSIKQVRANKSPLKVNSQMRQSNNETQTGDSRLQVVSLHINRLLSIEIMITTKI